MNCAGCNELIPKGTPAKVGDSQSGETEIQVVCPACRATTYTFTSDRQWAREDHALSLLKPNKRKRKQP